MELLPESLINSQLDYTPLMPTVFDSDGELGGGCTDTCMYMFIKVRILCSSIAIPQTMLD